MGKKPAVLIIGPLSPAVGGITTFISDILNSNLKNNFELTPFATNRPRNKDSNVSIKYLITCIIYTTYHLLIFPIILLIKKPDIIHIHTPSYWSFLENSYYVLVSKLFKKKVILHIHGGAFDHFYLNSSHVMKFYIKYIMSLSNRVVSLSEGWKSFFVVKIGLDENLVSIIRNGVIFTNYNISQEPKVKNGKFTVLFIGGTDAKRKGIYDIIKAIPYVIEAYPDVIFSFIGDIHLENSSNMLKDLKIKDHIRILGQVSEIDKIKMLNFSDLFILPSYAEGLPITILEAMAAGLPVISTTVGAIPEVIKDGVNGYLINPGDYEALAKNILILIKDDRIRNEIRQNNINLIIKDYDISTIVKNLNTLYATVLANNLKI